MKPKVITAKFAEKYPFLKAGTELTEEFIKTLSPSQQDTCNALNRRTEFTVTKTTFGLIGKDGKLDMEQLQKQQQEKRSAMDASKVLKNAIKKEADITPVTEEQH